MGPKEGLSSESTSSAGTGREAQANSSRPCSQVVVHNSKSQLASTDSCNSDEPDPGSVSVLDVSPCQFYFSADYARSARSRCQRCKLVLPLGHLRVAKIVSNFFKRAESIHQHEDNLLRYFHPACLFETFKRARASTVVISSTSDIQNYESLTAEDQELIALLISNTNQAAPSAEPPQSSSVLPPRSTSLQHRNGEQTKQRKQPTRVPKPRPTQTPNYKTKCSKPLNLDGLTTLYTNADQLTAKRLNELAALAQTHKPHIICVTEVNPKQATKERSLLDYQIPGYTQHPVNVCDPNGNPNGRGLMIYTIAALDDHVTLEKVTGKSRPWSRIVLVSHLSPW